MLAAAERVDPERPAGRGPADPQLLRVLRSAVRLEGLLGGAEGSPWLAFVERCLAVGVPDATTAAAAAEGSPLLSLSTIHGAKGDEAETVILYEYNTIGYESRSRGGGAAAATAGVGGGGADDDPGAGAEANLLYVAITRALRALTFVFPRSTSEIVSPLLARDRLYEARCLDGETADD
jgi:superfamily I DNA/RNA helicase